MERLVTATRFLSGSAWDRSSIVRYLGFRGKTSQHQPSHRIDLRQDHGTLVAQAIILCLPLNEVRHDPRISSPDFARLVGAIGEQVIQHHYGMSRSRAAFGDRNGQDHGLDMTMGGRQVNIKTMHRRHRLDDAIPGHYAVNLSLHDALRDDQAFENMYYLFATLHMGNPWMQHLHQHVRCQLMEGRRLMAAQGFTKSSQAHDMMDLMQSWILFRDGRFVVDHPHAVALRSVIRNIRQEILGITIHGVASRQAVAQGSMGVLVPAGTPRERTKTKVSSVIDNDIIEIPLAELGDPDGVLKRSIQGMS